MFSSADELMTFIQEEGVQFVDVRFCDLPGVMQHFNVPASTVDASFFTEGQMFDGSSRGPPSSHDPRSSRPATRPRLDEQPRASAGRVR